MSWIEKLLFSVFAFQAFALIFWITMVRREIKEENKEKKE